MNGPPPSSALLAALRELVAVVGRDGTFAWLGPRWEDELRTSRDHLMAQGWLWYLHPADRQAAQDALAHVDADGPAVRFEARWAHGDGHWVALSTVAVERDGSLVFATTPAVDHRKASIRLDRQLLLAESLMEMGSFYMDLRTMKVHWTPGMYALHKRDPGQPEPSGPEAIDAFHEEDRGRVGAAVMRCARAGVPMDFEARLVREDGEERRVRTVGAAEMAGGEVVGVFGVVHDVTDSAVRRTLASAEQLVYSAAHDLKQPVRTIRSYAQLLRAELGAPTERQGLWLDRIEEGCDRAAARIEGTLSLAKAGGARPVGPIALGRVLERVLEDLSEHIRETGAVVEVGELPTVVGEEAGLQQVFLNLLSNALRFRGDQPPRIQVTSEHRRGREVVWVADRGPGLPEDQTESIFKPFVRLDADAEGTGLGLAIVRRVLDGCGATVSGANRPDGGAVFTLRFRPG
ncbi:MAG: PAS domain-containing protein [Myxococcales bacterium]|nr:PAS domain-containing protein [Myxococcales bacterium]